MIFKLHNGRNWQKKVKIFFQGPAWKKTLTFLFFLLLAFGFWLLQALQQPFEKVIPIPIHYQNIPNEIILDNDVPTEIVAKIRDKGASVLKYTIGKRKHKSLDIDLESIDTKNVLYTISKKTLEAKISSSLAPYTSLISFTPDILDIKYQPLQKKELALVFSGLLSPATGYMLTDTALLTPSKVYAYGAENILDSLSAIYTESITVSNIQSPVKKRVKLIIPKSVNLSISEVELNVSAEEFTEKIIWMPVICKNLPENYKIHIFPSKVEVICPVALVDYGKVHESDFEVSIDYLELLKSQNNTTQVSLSKKTGWIQKYRINPEKVEFLIEQKH